MVILTSVARNLDDDLMKALGSLMKGFDLQSEAQDKDVIYPHTNDDGGGEKSV